MEILRYAWLFLWLLLSRANSITWWIFGGRRSVILPVILFSVGVAIHWWANLRWPALESLTDKPMNQVATFAIYGVLSVGVAVVSAWFVNLLFAPFLLWRDERKDNESFKSHLIPSVEIEFDSRKDVTKHKKQWMTAIRFRVRNSSQIKSINNVKVVGTVTITRNATDERKSGVGGFVGLPLILDSESGQIEGVRRVHDLNPSETLLFIVAVIERASRFGTKSGSFIIRFLHAIRVTPADNFSRTSPSDYQSPFCIGDSGSYKLSITVSGDNMSPVSEAIFISFNNDGKTKIQKQSKN